MRLQTVISTKELKSYYVLDVFGREKVVKAVDDINIDVYENEIYGIAGESGCGKSTLLKAIFGIIDPPLRLIAGKVLYFHNEQVYDLYSLNSDSRRNLRWKFISYVPQGSMNVLNPVVKIKETFKDFLDSHLKGKTKNEYYEMAKRTPDELRTSTKDTRSISSSIVRWYATKSYHSSGNAVKPKNYHSR